MRTLIVNGGNIDYDFALAFLEKEKFEYVIAVDKGMEFVKTAGWMPDEIVGDFDSGTEELLSYFKQNKVPIRRFKPEKDATDMEIAMKTALTRGSSEIVVLGATGTRMDHVLGSIRNLSIPLKMGVPCTIVDANNRIRLLDGAFRIKKEEQFGTYVSFLAYAGAVEGLTLQGFYYPLRDFYMEADAAIGISNEIVEEEALISFKKGRLMMIESRD